MMKHVEGQTLLLHCVIILCTSCKQHFTQVAPLAVFLYATEFVWSLACYEFYLQENIGVVVPFLYFRVRQHRHIFANSEF